MVQVPLPQRALRGGGTPALSAPRIGLPLDPRGAQLHRLGEATLRAGLLVARRAGELEERIHVAAVKEAQAHAEEKIAAGDVYMSTVGREALHGAREQAWEALQKELQVVEKGLEHDIQRTLFRQVMSRRLPGVSVRWRRHELAQLRVHEIGAGEAALAAKIDAMIRTGPAEEDDHDIQDPLLQTQQQLRDAVEAEARSLAAKKGLSDEATERLVKSKLTEGHVGIVKDLVRSGHVTKAREYLGQVESDMLAEDLGEMRDLVRRATVSEVGVQTAADILAELDDLPAAEQALRGLQHAQELLDAGQRSPEEHKAIAAEIRRRTQLMRAEELLVIQQADKRAEKLLVELGSGSSVDDLANEDPELYEEGRRLGRLDEWAKFANNDHNYPNDSDLYLRIVMGDPAVVGLRPDEFFNLIKTNLDSSHAERAAAIYQQMRLGGRGRGGTGAGGGGGSEIVTTAERSAYWARQLGFDDPDDFFLWEDRTQQAVNYQKSVLDRKLTQEEIDKTIVAEAKNEVTLRSSLPTAVHIGTVGLLGGSSVHNVGDLSPSEIRQAVISGPQLEAVWRDLHTMLPKQVRPPNFGRGVELAKIPPAIAAVITRQMVQAGRPPNSLAEIALRWHLAGRPRTIEEFDRGPQGSLNEQVEEQLRQINQPQPTPSLRELFRGLPSEMEVLEAERLRREGS